MVHSHPVVIPARLPPLGLIRPSRLITAAQGPRDRVHVQHVARLELGKASAGPCSLRTPAAQPSAPRPCVPRLPGAGCSPRRPRLAPGIPLPACLLRRGLQCACEAYLVALWSTGLWRTEKVPFPACSPRVLPVHQWPVIAAQRNEGASQQVAPGLPLIRPPSPHTLHPTAHRWRGAAVGSKGREGREEGVVPQGFGKCWANAGEMEGRVEGAAGLSRSAWREVYEQNQHRGSH